ncbi:hypothetical protein DFH27DRAFT_521871 [Peziza echinospora]|nr:hypothetical protein DFH27DRAFT_521871 [Peziza echinospora]
MHPWPFWQSQPKDLLAARVVSGALLNMTQAYPMSGQMNVLYHAKPKTLQLTSQNAATDTPGLQKLENPAQVDVINPVESTKTEPDGRLEAKTKRWEIHDYCDDSNCEFYHNISMDDEEDDEHDIIDDEKYGDCLEDQKDGYDTVSYACFDCGDVPESYYDMDLHDERLRCSCSSRDLEREWDEISIAEEEYENENADFDEEDFREALEDSF